MKEKILIIRFGSLGDIVLTSPTVTNLKINYPQSHIVYLCKEKYRSLVELIDGIDEIVTLPDNTSLAKYFKLLIELDKYNFDITVDLHGNIRSWWGRKIISADKVVVYPKRRMERLMAVKNKVIPDYWPHTIDLYNEAIKKLKARVYSKRPMLKIPEIVFDDSINQFIKNNKVFIVVAPGASYPTKQWPLERFAEMAVNLHKSDGVGIIWAITSTDEGKESPEKNINSSHFLKLVDCPLKKLTAIISKAALTVANDSGVAHLSSSVGTLVMAFFGPTHPVLGFAPRGLHDRVMQVNESCRPCSLHGEKKCYRDKQYCFTRIRPEIVSNAVAEILRFDINNHRAVFIDRDGTLIVDKHFLSHPDEIEFIPGTIEALKIVQRLGYKIVVISNQSGVARGFFDINTVEKVNARLVEMLVTHNVYVDAIYYCPHHPEGTVDEYAVECNCRKPSAGMAEDAAYQLGINLQKSFVIGDKVDDINLGKVIGATSIMVKTGYGNKQKEEIEALDFYKEIPIVEDLLDAVNYLKAVKEND
ncbi:MAG: HAD-IIIA family hydrolase [FCB group bacterium]|nr:HAD-IIIA family hydrolase [FCB group bacterium]